MGLSRQKYWSGLPCPPPGDLHNPGIEPRSPALQADSLPSEPPSCCNCVPLFPDLLTVNDGMNCFAFYEVSGRATSDTLSGT